MISRRRLVYHELRCRAMSITGSVQNLLQGVSMMDIHHQNAVVIGERIHLWEQLKYV
jgi:predicted Na+-dependent transporter